jgi:hypothetical protein
MKTNAFLTTVCLFTILVAGVGVCTAAKVLEVPAEEPAAEEETAFEDIQLPENNSPEYWMVRSEAMGELTPLLTKKRAEMKQKRQISRTVCESAGYIRRIPAAGYCVAEETADLGRVC